MPPPFDTPQLLDTDNPLVLAWHAALETAGPAARALLADIADTGPTDLADRFYAVMLADHRATRFLSHDQVRGRLKPALQRWLDQLLHATPDHVAELIAAQHVIGDVHARVGIPVDLVARGARVLKQHLFTCIAERAAEPALAYAAIGLLSASIDIALESMTQAYSKSRERSSRTDATYRLFSLMQNAGTERERQRALLLDWENNLLFALASPAADNASRPLLAHSEFGLWFTHKGLPSFGESSETRSICELIEKIDAELAPASAADLPARFAVVQQVRQDLTQIRQLLGMLFERVGELDAGLDAMTNLLNRRFLPTVLRREIDQSAKSGTPFAALLLDLDHFKAINDQYGHDAGDRALQHVASLLTQFTRGSDYLFRYGGEEFLVVLVAVTEPQALVIAENLCKRIAMSPVRLGDEQLLPVTASIGVAVYDGHPDYEQLINRADSAMYQAKTRGRNRVVAAGPDTPLAPGLRPGVLRGER